MRRGAKETPEHRAAISRGVRLAAAARLWRQGEIALALDRLPFSAAEKIKLWASWTGLGQSSYYLTLARARARGREVTKGDRNGQ
jgi:hypothetical protein